MTFRADLAVLFEHPEWQKPLFQALDRRGVRYLAVDLKKAAFSDGDAPFAPLYFNQASPSAYVRGNTRAGAGAALSRAAQARAGRQRRAHHARLVANNGAAGMPNAFGTNFGILTRIGTSPSPLPTLYGRAIRGVAIDALPIRYDNARWQEDFLKNWPAGSPAWLSYFNRIADGPDHRLQRSV